MPLFPQGPWEDAANVILQAEVASAFSPLIRFRTRQANCRIRLGRVGGYVNQTISGADYTTALRVREILQQNMRTLFDSYDVLVAASQPVPATPLSAQPVHGIVICRSAGRNWQSLWIASPLRSLRIHGKEASGGTSICRPGGR